MGEIIWTDIRMNEIFSKCTIVHSSDATNFASLHFDGNIRALRDFRY